MTAGSDGQRKSTYGFKARINVDEDGLIKWTDDTPGNVHDSNCFTPLLDGDDAAVYADSAYASEMHAKWLMAHKVENPIIKRAYRNKSLTMQDKQGTQARAVMLSELNRTMTCPRRGTWDRAEIAHGLNWCA